MEESEGGGGGLPSVAEMVGSLDSRQITLLIAGLATILASQISLNLVSNHIKHWRHPLEQRAIVAIIAMVPLYAIDSYFALAEMPGSEVVSTIFDSIKECYEAYVISRFLVLMYAYMGVSSDPSKPLPDSIKGRAMHHSFPFTLFYPHEVIADRKSLRLLTLWAQQFVIIRPLFSVLMCALELLGIYHGPVTWLFSAVFNLSVYVAIYSLLMFYHSFEAELAPHKPLAKFLCIKGVVFFAFWQGLVVKLLTMYGIIHKGHMPYTVTQIEEAVQNFLVCVEMLLFSFAFQYAFSAYPYTPEGMAKKVDRRGPADSAAQVTETKKDK